MEMETSLTDKGVPLASSSSDSFFFLSLSSWIMLVVTSWMPILVLGLNKNELIAYLWLFDKEKEDYDDEYYYYRDPFPLDMNFVVFNIAFIFTFILGTVALIVYIYSMFKKNNNVINGMLGGIAKFHFIPLFLISALFIIGESYSEDYYNEAKFIFSIIFTFLAIVTLIFISLKTQLESPWYAALTINKGVYSCFLALLIYNFGYVFTIYGMYKLIKKGKYEDYSNWAKRCYLAFTIIIGILNNAVAFLLKDLVVSLMNILIYVGMTINYFKMPKEARKQLYKNETIGIFEIIMMVMSVVYIVFHLIRYRGLIPNQF